MDNPFRELSAIRGKIDTRILTTATSVVEKSSLILSFNNEVFSLTILAVRKSTKLCVYSRFDRDYSDTIIFVFNNSQQ